MNTSYCIAGACKCLCMCEQTIQLFTTLSARRRLRPSSAHGFLGYSPPPSLPPVMTLLWSRVSVGIFSRDDESSYQWLTSRLSTSRHVRSVYPVYVSNHSAVSVRDGARRCALAILYHTKRRGRINIADVTDSLYDAELEYLSSAKGKFSRIHPSY